jgi:hypothetical protein
MASPHPLYRSLVHLYPSAFRREYSQDLVDHYADLVADRGARAAWTRTALDLAITIPRYHLEHVMTEQHSATTLSIIIGLFAVGGLFSLMAGLYPGIALFAVAVGLAVAQRSTLARALRVPDANRGRLVRAIRSPDSSLRTHRLRISALSAGALAACVIAYVIVTWDGEASTPGLLIPTLLGTFAVVGAVWFLAAGLLTPRSTHEPGR